jgi:hypothetical protein
MPDQVSAVIVAEPKYAPGKYVIFRADFQDPGQQFVWCGRSFGWLPFPKTSSAFYRFFSSPDEANEAAAKHITLPVQE